MKTSLHTKISMITFLVCLFFAIIMTDSPNTKINKIPFAGSWVSFIVSSALLIKDNSYD